MSDMIMRACGFAKKAHKGQMYGDEDYFQGHLGKVANKYCKLFGEDDLGVTCCYLHDVIEDTGTLPAELTDKFGVTVTEVVSYLTRNSDETYEEYLKGLTNNPLSCKVKYCDSFVNLQKCISTEDWRRAKKYLNNLEYLKDYL